MRPYASRTPDISSRVHYLNVICSLKARTHHDILVCLRQREPGFQKLSTKAKHQVVTALSKARRHHKKNAKRLERRVDEGSPKDAPPASVAQAAVLNKYIQQITVTATTMVDTGSEYLKTHKASRDEAKTGQAFT